MLDTILRTIKRFIPKKIFGALQPTYHYLLAFFGALIYRFPSRKIYLIGITGTKGKTSTAELVNAVLEKAGYETALASTLRMKLADESKPNRFKMTMPGRFFVHSFLRRAVDAGCTHAIIEMTSEGAKQFRHKFLALDVLIFTNITPEHIESHGSFENYLAAKLSIAHALAASGKKDRAVIANADDQHGKDFLATHVSHKYSYSLSQATIESQDETHTTFLYNKTRITLPLPGVFNLSNALAAITLGTHLGIDINTIKTGLESVDLIRGRMEYVDEGQPFSVVVDYAHTAESLESAYGVFAGKRKICVLGSTGGGRDKWKRDKMGAVADTHCDEIILTNEDPYDEDPMTIIGDVKKGITHKEATVIMDRREAIREAFKKARAGDVVLITGKGTDPYIMEANGKKTPWDDATVAREELAKLA